MGLKPMLSRGIFLAAWAGMIVFPQGKGFASGVEAPQGFERTQEMTRHQKRPHVVRRNQSNAAPSTLSSHGFRAASIVSPAGPPLFDRQVNDAITYDGKVYVVGGFDQVSNERLGYGIPVDKATGKPIANFDAINDQVYSVVEDGNGGWVISGDFSKVGNSERKGLAHILPNGKLDTAWNPDGGTNVYYDTMDFFQGKLYVIAYTSSNLADGYRTKLVRFNLNLGQPEKEWVLNETGDLQEESYFETIKAVEGRVYLGGFFSKLQGEQHNNIAALDTSTGKVLSDWAGDTDGAVEKILVTKNAVIAGGRFGKANGVTRRAVASFSISSGAVLAWDPLLNNANDHPDVYTMAANGNTLYLGGTFYSVGTSEVTGFAAIDLETAKTIPFRTDWVLNNYVDIVASDGGTFYLAVGSQLLATNNSGEPLGWNPNVHGWTRSLTPGSQAIFIALDGLMGGESRDGIAAYDLNSGAIDDFNPGLNNNYYGSFLLDGTTLYTAAGRLSAIDLKTNTVTPWLMESNVRGITAFVKKDDVMYVGGYFSSIEDQPREGLAAFDIKTGELLPWAPKLGDGYTFVHTMAVVGDSILVGGQFDSVDGLNRNNLVAISTRGVVQVWDPSPNNIVHKVLVEGNKIYVGGSFSQINSEKRNGLAVFDVFSLSLLSGWNPDVSFDDGYSSSVSSIFISNGIIYVGGDFNRVYGDQVRNSLAAFRESDGSLLPWNPNLSNYPTVSFVKALGDRVFVGGDFSSANGIIQKSLAEFPLAQMEAGVPLSPRNLTLTQRSTSTLSVQWDASPGATSYKSFLSVKDSPKEALEETTNTFSTRNDLKPNTAYTLTVKACSSAGCSSIVSLDAYTLAAVPGVTATSVQATSIGLKIEPNGNPTGTIYVLQQAESPNGPFGKEETTDGTEGIVDDLFPDSNYYFRVYAKNFDGSNTDYSTVLTVKTGFEAKFSSESIGVVSNTSISASWVFDPPGTTYRLVASTLTVNPLASFVRVQEVSEQAGTLADLSPNTWYSLFVKTCAEGRCSNYNSIGFTTTLANVPSLVADTSDPREPSLRINANGNPDGTLYVVEKSEDGGNTFVTFIETVGLEVDTSDLPVGKTFQFRVSAKNSAGKMTDPSAVTPFKTDDFSIDQTRAYPVPFRPGQGKDVITFDSFPVGSTLRLYTMRGELVRTINPDANFYEWDVRNQEGTAVSSGVYLVRISGSGGDKTFKIVVQR